MTDNYSPYNHASDSDVRLLALIKQLTKVEIVAYEKETSTVRVDDFRGTTFCPTGELTIKLTCRSKEPKEDRIEQLEEQNKELKDKLNKLNEIINTCFLCSNHD